MVNTDPSRARESALAPVASQATLRLGTWPYDPTIALITVTDHAGEIDRTQLVNLVDQAKESGARLIRTGALRTSGADLVTAIGFRAIDELLLFECLLDHRHARRPSRRVRPLHRWHLRHASAVDRVAFGPRWAHDTAALADAIGATPFARATRTNERRSPVTGFAVSGLSGSTGYVQRLAVSPAHRHRGLGTTLVADAVAWMVRRGADRALVNTSVTNRQAAALYQSCGFVPLAERLLVAEFDLTGPPQ